MKCIVIKKILPLFIITVACLAAKAQQVPLDAAVQNRFNEITISEDTNIFTGFRAINWLELKPYLKNRGTDIMDSVFGISNDGTSYAFKQMGVDNWIKAATDKHVFTVDPYITLAGGYANNAVGGLLQAAGGVQFQGIYNDKLSYSFGLTTGYRQFPGYIDSYIVSNQNYQPGLGKGTLQNNGYTSTQFNANLTYIGGKHFVLATGYGKNFIGDGYRSLILSDNASNNPYIRLQTKLWRFTYNVLYTRYENPRFTSFGKTEVKYSTLHYLGINFSKKIQIALYDNITWLKNDTTSQRGFDVQYLNPLIFMRPIEFTFGSPDNAFIGITGKYHIYKNGFIYGQIGLDDLNLSTSIDHHSQNYGNKYALQFGIWNKDLFHVQNLSWRLEWNGVRPYTYGHGFGKVGLNYTHNNQSLADPFNANFNEFISIFNYHNDRWYGMLENLFTVRGENPGLPYNNGEDLWGGEVGVPLFGAKTMQGTRHHYFYNQFSAGYLLNTRNRLAVQADIVYRKHTSPGISSSDVFFMLGIQTRIFNNYHDF
jgi:hypothetical protein